MSDVWDNLQYAQVWDEEKQSTQDICLGWGTPASTAEVDATEAVLAKVEAYKAECERKRYERQIRHDVFHAIQAHRSPKPGKQMVVARGRKVPKGTVGVVFWLGEDSYGNAKAGIRTSDEKDGRKWKDVVWVAARHLEPVDAFDVVEHFSPAPKERPLYEKFAKDMGDA